MPRAYYSPFLRTTPFLLLGLLSACDRGESRTETAGATVPADAGAVPITTGSEDARRLYLQGRDLAEQLRAHDGRQLFQQAVQADPSFAMAHYQLAVNSATAKDFFEHLKHAVELSSKVSEGERLTILALEAGGNAQPAKQLEYLTELVAKYPDDARAHFLLGGSHFGRLEFDQAAEHYQAATRLDPAFSPAYNLLGYTYRQMEKYGEAETAFKKYIELIPADPNPYDSYAELLMRTGRFDESIAQYRKALAIDPRFGASQIGIASNLMLQGKHDEAIAEAQKLYDAARDDGDRRTAMFAQVVIDADRGKTAQALQRMERLYALGAKSADTGAMA